ncbi:hypothetical protein OK016_24030 [Vibrio chagasii]|nr:hypothetical protein [Vibrio chagasii]
MNDGHVDSQEATNTLHIDAVSDAAQISGVDTGDVGNEGHSSGDMSQTTPIRYGKTRASSPQCVRQVRHH